MYEKKLEARKGIFNLLLPWINEPEEFNKIIEDVRRELVLERQKSRKKLTERVIEN